MRTFTSLIARIFLSVPFIVFGINHFMSGSQMAGMVPSFVPGGVFWVYLTGVALIAGGVAILTRYQYKLAGYLLAVMLLVFVLTIHLPQLFSGNAMAIVGVVKDLGLAGAVLMFVQLTQDEKEVGQLGHTSVS